MIQLAKVKDKFPSQGAGRRVNFYVREDVKTKEVFEQLADILHKEGARGVYSSNGEPNKSAILQRLIDDKLKPTP